MRKRFVLLAALVLMLAAFAAPAPALAARSVSFVKDQTAEALFARTDGCIATTAFVVATKNMTRTIPGSRSRTAGVTIDISSIDTCADPPQVLMDAHSSGTLHGEEFQVGPLLNRASLEAIVHMVDFANNNAEFNLRIEMSWRGIGEVALQNNHDHVDAPDCTIDSFLVGASRSATALIEVNGRSRSMVHVSSRSTEANIMWVTNGQIQDGCAS